MDRKPNSALASSLAKLARRVKAFSGRRENGGPVELRPETSFFQIYQNRRFHGLPAPQAGRLRRSTLDRRRVVEEDLEL